MGSAERSMEEEGAAARPTAAGPAAATRWAGAAVPRSAREWAWATLRVTARQSGRDSAERRVRRSIRHREFRLPSPGPPAEPSKVPDRPLDRQLER